MEYRWINDTEPDENGDYVAVIVNRQGEITSRFAGKTHKEVADKLLASQVQANRQIGRLVKPDRARRALEANPQELSTDDKFRLSQALDDPSRRVDAVAEIMDKRLGAPAGEVGSTVAGISQEDAKRYFDTEAQAFVEAHPSYYPVQQNQEALIRELEAMGIEFSRNNLAIAFARLLDRGGLVLWPDSVPSNGNGSSNHDTDAQPSATPPTRQRNIQSIATGIRSSDATAMKPRPQSAKTFTRIEIESMSKAEFNERMRDPAFRKAVDAM